jgi:hypothetical protein
MVPCEADASTLPGLPGLWLLIWRPGAHITPLSGNHDWSWLSQQAMPSVRTAATDGPIEHYLLWKELSWKCAAVCIGRQSALSCPMDMEAPGFILQGQR